MIYETVYIGQSQCFLVSEDLAGWDKIPFEKAERVIGTLVELKSWQDGFVLTIATQNETIAMIHSKRVVLTSYSILSEDKILSLYEVLWAANVELNPMTLYPVISKKNETSLKNLYCLDLKDAG